MSTSKQLELNAVIGFAGNVPGGLCLHKDDQHILYALGSTIVVKTLLKNEQYFLNCGSSETQVSCMALSNDGKLLATGQKTHAGFPVSVWIWDLSNRKVLHKLDRYKTKIQGISFSPNNKYVATLGGEDDNKIIIWDIENGDAICGSPAANDTALAISYSNKNDNKLITCGKYNFRIWDFDGRNRKIRPTDCKLGQFKRIFNCLAVDPDDKVIYAGTQSGDLLQLSLEYTLFQAKGPTKKPFSMGIQSVELTNSGDIIIGAGDGTISLLSKNKLSIIRSLKLEGLISSISLNKSGDHFFIGTNKSLQYLVALNDFDYELRSSSHYSKINDICFPYNYSDLFITAGINDIRVWHSINHNELLRIQLQDPKLECLCVIISKDGTSIISGWNDGKVRAFFPESGKLMYTIHDCHSNGVTSLALSNNGKKLITGGNDSIVRVWSINKSQNIQKMLASLKEHKSTISCITINNDENNNNNEFITSSTDGSCVLWDLNQLTRINALFASTQFLSILYHPDQSQLLTCGTDRQITYWDATDVSTIRVIQGSNSGAVNSLSILKNGKYFTSCGADRLVKLWHYDEGSCKGIGIGHSGNIKKCKIAPNGKTIVSVGEEGAIMIWTMPEIKDSANKEN